MNNVIKLVPKKKGIDKKQRDSIIKSIDRINNLLNEIKKL